MKQTKVKVTQEEYNQLIQQIRDKANIKKGHVLSGGLGLVFVAGWVVLSMVLSLPAAVMAFVLAMVFVVSHDWAGKSTYQDTGTWAASLYTLYLVSGLLLITRLTNPDLAWADIPLKTVEATSLLSLFVYVLSILVVYKMVRFDEKQLNVYVDDEKYVPFDERMKLAEERAFEAEKARLKLEKEASTQDSI